MISTNNISIHKFGGASVKNAEAVRNIAIILKPQTLRLKKIIVVSAMGKTTNELEKVGEETNEETAKIKLQAVAENHISVSKELGLEASFLQKLQSLFILPSGLHDDARYDELVAIGELASTMIVAEYLKVEGFDAAWWDVRNTIITDARHRSARVDEDKLSDFGVEMVAQLDCCDTLVTQGFIGKSQFGLTTTLGREGSDYSAALLATASGAAEVIIWKDVQGMHNADPNIFNGTVTIEKLDYSEALELSYYGASVIHPRTVKPIKNRRIPLYVKSFLNPEGLSTCIGDFPFLEITTPMYISRPDITCLSLGPSDHSFVGEDHLQTVFGALAEAGIHVRMMQNSAVRFEIAFDTDFSKQKIFESELGIGFWSTSRKDIELLTVRHGTEELINKLSDGREVLMEQINPSTTRRLLGVKTVKKV
mgnify:CR=1 FL=1